MSRPSCAQCGRAMILRPGAIEETCGECDQLPDYCPCGPLHADPDPGLELRLIAARYTKVDWHAAWAAKPLTVNWLVKPFIEAGTVNALYAVPGTGKSLIALEWALRIVRNGGSVCYIDEENRLQEDIVERLQAMGATPDELDRLAMYSFQELPALDTPAGGTHLLALAIVNDAQLVIIDTASRMIHGSENDADTWNALYNHSVKPLKGRGIAVLRIDHPGKDGERGQRGSSAKNGDVDMVWKLTQVEQGSPHFRMECEKSRSGHTRKGDVIPLERRYVPLRHIWTVRDNAPKITPLGQLCGQLRALQVPPSAGRTACRTALTKAGISASNDLLSDVVRHRKFGCNCPGQVPDSTGRSDSAVTRPPTVRRPPTPIGGDGGQVSGDQSQGTLGDWPENSMGAEAS